MNPLDGTNARLATCPESLTACLPILAILCLLTYIEEDISIFQRYPGTAYVNRFLVEYKPPSTSITTYSTYIQYASGRPTPAETLKDEVL